MAIVFMRGEFQCFNVNTTHIKCHTERSVTSPWPFK